jgi:hypothetical protein
LEVGGYRIFSKNATIGDFLVTLRLDGALAVARPADADQILSKHPEVQRR